MPHVQTELNKAEHKELTEQCARLGESEYEFVKKSIRERMTKNRGFLARASAKANELLYKEV